MLIPADPAAGSDDEAVMTRAEVARFFRVHKQTVTKWAAAGKIRSFRTIGGHRRYNASEVRAFLSPAGPAPGSPADPRDQP